MLNGIVWNRTVYLYKVGLALNNLQKLICHKTQTNKEMYWPQLSIFAPLKSKAGNTTLTQSEVRWCEHYTELLNRHPIVDEFVLDLIEQREPVVSLDEELSWDEINMSVKQINNDKAPGMERFYNVVETRWSIF